MLEYDKRDIEKHPILLFQVRDGPQGLELCVQEADSSILQMLAKSKAPHTAQQGQDYRQSSGRSAYQDWLELIAGTEQPAAEGSCSPGENDRTAEEKRGCSTLFHSGLYGKEYCWHLFNIFTLRDLQGHIVKTIGLARDINGNSWVQGQSEHQLDYDDLTKTYNRRRFWQILQKCRENDKINFSLILFDVNGLKLVNHVFGHSKGDYVLTQVALGIKSAFYENRHIARIDGDQFAVIAYSMDAREIEACCLRVARFCRETDTQLLPVSVSWGIAHHLEAQNIEDLFRIAENRMLDNKAIQRSSAYSQAVYSLKEALRVRNAETSEHLLRLEKMVEVIGIKLSLSSNDLARLKLLASMHDVGKLGIPDHVLGKAGPLSPEEWKIMQTHCEIGQNIMGASIELSGIAQEVLSHHERWDGTGYPLGKKGDQIPLLAQIISVVDAYDVMTHQRVYKAAISHQDAILELIQCRGTQFSPAATDLFLEAFGTLAPDEINHLFQEEA